MSSYYSACLTLRGSCLRRLLHDFTRAIIPSSDCCGAEAAAAAFKGDGRKTSVPAVQKRPEKKLTNIILQHHNSSNFQKNYASRYMPDTQAAYRGSNPQTALMRAASGMSRNIDPRRPRKLNATQQAEVDRHPEVRLLRRKFKSLLQTFQDQKRSIASMKRDSLT